MGLLRLATPSWTQNQAREGSRRHAEALLEQPGEVGLVREPATGCRVGDRASPCEQLARPLHPSAHHEAVRCFAGVALEGAGEMRRRKTGDQAKTLGADPPG